MASGSARCVTCSKHDPKYHCDGCLQKFCGRHLKEHQKKLKGQLGQIVKEHEQFTDTLNEQKHHPANPTLRTQIDEWEKASIETVQRAARECRDALIGQTKQVVDQIEHKLAQFTSELRHIQKEDDVNETNIQMLTHKLTKMRTELSGLSTIFIRENSQTLIKKIHVSLSNSRQREDQDRSTSSQKQSEYRRWKKHANTVAGGNEEGDKRNQFHDPTFLFVDDEQSIYVSDSGNHRVMKWKKDLNKGVIVAGGNGQGNSLNQLSDPQGVIVDRWGQIYVADCDNHRVMRWREGDKEGKIIVGGNDKGDKSNQLSCPVGLSFDDEGNLYVADHNNDRIQKFDLSL